MRSQRVFLIRPSGIGPFRKSLNCYRNSRFGAIRNFSRGWAEIAFERELIATKSIANRLEFAVLFAFFRNVGCFPQSLAEINAAAQTARATANLLCGAGEKVGVLQVRLYRPFSAADFLAAIPSTVRSVAVLEETKEPGSKGEPLYLDVTTTLAQNVARYERPYMTRVIGGRFGIASRDLTPWWSSRFSMNCPSPNRRTLNTVSRGDSRRIRLPQRSHCRRG